MPTKILDIAIEETVRGWTGLAGYDAALFLVRHGTRPIGKVTVPVVDGAILPGRVRGAITARMIDALAASMSEAELQAGRAKVILPSATVAICTRERPVDLHRALTALVALDDLGQTVLVIDNCPRTDATQTVTAGFPGVRYICEPQKGLNNARNRALAEAEGEIVAFIDDDAVADAGWLAALVAPFADARVDCVTGLTMPLELETPAQELFESLSGFSRRGFSLRVFQAPRTRPLETGQIGAGANMAVRRDLLARIGPFDPALDAGTETQSGGDHEYFTRILRGGGRIIYQPSALNWHRHRRSHAELVSAIGGYGTGVYAAWTRSFLSEGEWGVFRRAFGWFIHDQLPTLIRSYRRPATTLPREVLWAELKGCAKGPGAYLRARAQAREAGHGQS